MQRVWFKASLLWNTLTLTLCRHHFGTDWFVLGKSWLENCFFPLKMTRYYLEIWWGTGLMSRIRNVNNVDKNVSTPLYTTTMSSECSMDVSHLCSGGHEFCTALQQHTSRLWVLSFLLGFGGRDVISPVALLPDIWTCVPSFPSWGTITYGHKNNTNARC